MPLRAFGAARAGRRGLASTARGRASRFFHGSGQPGWAAWKRAIVGWSGTAALFEALHGVDGPPATAEGKAAKPAESRFDLSAFELKRRAYGRIALAVLLITHSLP